MLVTESQNERLVQTEKPFILPEQVEEEAHIIHIDFYKIKRWKLIVFGVLTLLTVGFLALLVKWKNSIRILFLYVKANPSEANYLLIKGLDGTREHITVERHELNLDGTKRIYRTFDYRLYMFYFDVAEGIYRPIQFTIKNQTYEDLHKKKGNTFEEYEKNLLNYGENSTNVPRKSDLEILVDEVLSPFYMFQLFAVIFWGFFNNYAIYAGFIFAISVITLALGFFKIKSNHQKLQEKAFYETEVKIFSLFTQNGDKSKPEERIIRSTFLVPGDLIEIPNNKKMPCDIILLNGTCVMNESMLTGESVPVIKQQLPRTDKVFDAISADPYILFSGTECLETRNIDPKTPVVGMVFRTGFSTMKGRLVRSFLYSKPENFKFYRDSLKYIGAMSLVAMLCFAFTIKSLVDQGEEVGAIIRRSLDIITIAVPPALPTCVAIGASIASARLEKKKIITKSELKINVAGKVQFMCFDKTGTLTRDSLDLHGVRPMGKGEASSTEFQSLITNHIHRGLNYTSQKNLSHKLLELMATCHSLTYVRDSLTGDPLDMRMFEAAGWRLTESSSTSASNSQSEARLCTLNPPADEEAGYYTPTSQVLVLKRFEFSPKLQRMSVIIKDQREKLQRVYVKGSPEMIATLCKPETIPNDFPQTLLSYTQSGLRVIACATKNIEENVTVNDELDREPYEKDLEFLGFLIFENKMKEITPSIINKLKAADINTIMLTGDNPLTAIFVARGCGIVEPTQKVILGTLVPAETSQKIEWKVIQGLKIEPNLSTEAESPAKINIVNQISIELPERPAGPLTNNKQEEKVKEVEVNYDEVVPQRELFSMLENDSNIAIAMTGDAFNYFDSSTVANAALHDAILRKAKVLARMRPDDKAFIVDKLQNQGYIVGMCGDGANDCPALKVANVGVSLSESEASLAAPFMSKITDISCIDILLREGRTALVTSFQCFKFMSMYSLIQTVTVVLLYTRATAMTDPSFLYQDLLVIIPAAFTMALTLPTSRLSKQQPTGSLLSLTVLTSMLGQCVIQAVAQYLALVFLQNESWYKSPTELYDEAEVTDDETIVPDYDSTMLFHVGNMQYIATVLAFSIGKPFRKPFYTNFYFTLSIGLVSALSIIIILVPVPFLMDFLMVKEFDGNEGFRVEIVIFIAINAAVTLSYEKFVVPLFVHLGKQFALRNKKKELTVIY